MANKSQNKLAASSYLKAIVCPRTELHDAGLLVEGEVLDVDLARGLVDGGRAPLHAARVVQRGLRRQRHLEVAVRTVRQITYYLNNRPSVSQARPARVTY